MILLKLVAYGMVGMMIEVWFTGLARALSWIGDLADEELVGASYDSMSLKGHTYLYMFPVYGIAALSFELARYLLGGPYWAMAFVYTLLIYLFEYGSGWILQKTIGFCPWEYKNQWTLHGLVSFSYIPFWFSLALCFEPLSRVLHWALTILARAAVS